VIDHELRAAVEHRCSPAILSPPRST
jgi:hypothetical protein